jgi:predicted MPP superfamily phosphohydrolase
MPYTMTRVSGNHDYAAGAAAPLTAALESAGVEVLRNESVAVERGDEALHVVGIGPLLPGHAEPAEALAVVPDAAPRIVLTHNPDVVASLPAGSAPLAVAGHTHGGQIRVPFKPQWSWLALVQGGAVTVDGWIDGYGAPGNRLYVNRGIGMSVLPVRPNCRPAVTFFTLEGV